MGVRGCGLGYDHRVPEVLQKKFAPMNEYVGACVYYYHVR